MTLNRIYLILIVFISSLYAVSSGQRLFESAEAIRESRPQEAIEIYYKVLNLKSSSIDAKLKEAARWQIAILAEQTGRYPEAAEILSRKTRTKEGQKRYAQLMKIIYNSTQMPPNSQTKWFRALRTQSSELSNLLSQYPGAIHGSCTYLKHYKSSSACEELLSSMSNNEAAVLYHAEIKISNQKISSANQLLQDYEKLLSEKNLPLTARYYYLQGKIARTSGKPENAISAFRLAAEYETIPKEKQYYNSLAALELYKQAQYSSAANLLEIGNTVYDEHPNVTLLRALVDCKIGKCKKLRSVYREIRSDTSGVYSTYLQDQARKIINAK